MYTYYLSLPNRNALERVGPEHHHNTYMTKGTIFIQNVLWLFYTNFSLKTPNQIQDSSTLIL